jgi:hypothetical protein
MKKIIVMTCLGFVTAFNSIAQDNSPAATRANRLSDQMIRELRLNNFQASRLRAINQDKVSKMMVIESKYASDPTTVDKNCLGVCKERDKELSNFLSSDQYSAYFANRSQYYKADKDFAAQIGLIPSATAKKKPANLPIGNKVVTEGAKQAVLKPGDSK